MATKLAPKNNDAQLAAALIGVRQKPQGFAALKEAALEARAYDALQPYPVYAFRNWKTEDRGPLPRCMPVPRRIARRGAKFLFGKGIELSCHGNEVLEEYMRDAWVDNQMPSRAVAMARKGAVEGGIVLKFSYDPDCIPALRIQTLSLIDQVRLYCHPHDRQKLLLARIQYRYWEATTGKWMWYREEWTDAEQVTYPPLAEEKLGTLGGKIQDADESEAWEAPERIPNPFGTIPLVAIKNLDTDDLYGEGDLWGLYRVVDDLNLCWYQMKRSNQFDSELNPYFIDLELDDDDLDRPAAPGQPNSLHSIQDGKGQVVFPNGGNGLRPALMEYAKELRKEIEDGAGTVNVSQADVTNKGNLTQAVLTQMYAILIEQNQEKQKAYGQNGIELFLEKAARALQNLGVVLGVTDDPDSWDVQVQWPEPFPLTEEEKTAKVNRIGEEVNSGFITHERAVQIIAPMEGIRDVEALIDELEKEPKPSPTENEPNVQEPQDNKE